MAIGFVRIEGNEDDNHELLLEAVGLLERGFLKQYRSELLNAVYEKYDAERDAQEMPQHAPYHQQRVGVAGAKIKKLEQIFKLLNPAFGENSGKHYSLILKDLDF